MRCGCYYTICNSVGFCIVTLNFDVRCHSSCYRIHIFIRKVYCALMGICHLHLCANGFGIRYKICACQQSQYHNGDYRDTITDNPWGISPMMCLTFSLRSSILLSAIIFLSAVSCLILTDFSRGYSMHHDLPWVLRGCQFPQLCLYPIPLFGQHSSPCLVGALR